MLKVRQPYDECETCDYFYKKEIVTGCIFPNHAPIDMMGRSSCNNGQYCNLEIDEDFVQIKNIKQVTIL
jgi:hypothetical protein